MDDMRTSATDSECQISDDQGVPSPCVRMCQLDGEGKACTGCGRTLDEIRRWTRMSDEEKYEVRNRVGVDVESRR